jgi:alkaline phosphatase
MNRREFLLTSSTAAALGLGGPTLAGPARPRHTSGGPPRARNLIFMVSDGMSTGTLTLADLYRRQHHRRACAWVGLWSRPGVRRATSTTYSADAWVTDSAAAGSAWGCGRRVNNGVLNITDDGRQHVPLLVQARQAGKATGLVTTTRVTHATPASFIANAPKRDQWRIIAPQILDRGVDVVLGGGGKHFSESLLTRHPGLHIVRDRAALDAAPEAGRLLGLFAPDHIPMVYERTPEVPSLTHMTRAALSRLDTNPEGFVLQVEGGRVDHAAHNNDAGSVIMEQLDFDDAIAGVLEWAEGRDDTLVIITTDHANANPGLTLYGGPGRKAFDRIPAIRHSFDWVWEELEKLPGAARPGAVADLAEAATGIGLGKGSRELLAAAVEKKRVMPFAGANTWTSVLGAALADEVGVAFTGPNHTSDFVEVTALGPGSELLKPFVDNTDLHALTIAALGLPEAQPLPGMEQLVEPARGVTDD